MRTKNILSKLDDVTIFNQYLYMSEYHYIDFNIEIRGRVRLHIDEDLKYYGITKEGYKWERKLFN